MIKGRKAFFGIPWVGRVAEFEITPSEKWIKVERFRPLTFEQAKKHLEDLAGKEVPDEVVRVFLRRYNRICIERNKLRSEPLGEGR